MSTRTIIESLCQHVGQEVTLSGWLYHKRGSKKLHFLLVRDGSGTCQAIVSQADVSEEMFALSGGLTQESAIEISGTVNADARAPGAMSCT